MLVVRVRAIGTIDPAWISELRELISTGPCEFIGSGYAQIVGPLVPAQVNAANLRIGHRVYEELLGIRPTIALINEHTPGFSDRNYEFLETYAPHIIENGGELPSHLSSPFSMMCGA